MERRGVVGLTPSELSAFRERVYAQWRAHGRHDLPWRRTTDPWAVLVSEVMLQQTQVPRVLPKYAEFLEAFPTPDALAAAPLEAVLRIWRGLGYQRRALALKRSAETLVGGHGGTVPRDESELLALPGVGPATAAGVRVFAFAEPAVYLETNVRTVFIHEFFADADGVHDREIIPLVEATLDRRDPRSWYFALLDFGHALKREIPNPGRRSAHHTRQSRFEGSRRQRRAKLLRTVVDAPAATVDALAATLALEPGETADILDDLVREGFLRRDGEGYSVAD